VFYTTHSGINQNRGAWAQALIFMTQSRRVTITMTRARVHDLREPSGPLVDWRPAEVVFDSRVRSPEVARRWGITTPVCERTLDGAVPPIHRFPRDGAELPVGQVLFDDLVLATESQLDLQLAAEEIDLDPRYGVSEPAASTRTQALGSGVLTVPVTTPGTYAFQAGDWSCEIAVSVFDYPFAPPSWTLSTAVAARAAPAAVRVPGKQLVAVPNPFRSEVKLLVPGRSQGSPVAGSAGYNGHPSGPAPDVSGTLHIYDAAGRWVQSITAPIQDGFRWDGRDAKGNDLPAGIYFQRLSMPDGRSFVGRTQRIR
jgi:flagellar hook capping protein FlgD